jgi:hypothetical protein
MKKLILLLITVLLLTSCQFVPYTDRHTKKIPLRQLVKSETKETYSSASFFLIAGSASSGTYTTTDVKAMGAVDGEYRYLQMDFQKVRIKLDNTVKIPYVIINYRDDHDEDINNLLKYEYNIDSYTIVCPEHYLPEHLLPIQL